MMGRIALALSIITAVSTAASKGKDSITYELLQRTDATNFFSFFEFESWLGNDPTHGFVEYVDQATAQELGMAKAVDGRLYLGVNYNASVSDESPPKSIRVHSRLALQGHNLVLLDLEHMPTTAQQGENAGCALWPAFWLLGSAPPSWPANGEIDIIEFANNLNYDQSTLHSSYGCFQDTSEADFDGYWASTGDCNLGSGANGTLGCGIASPNASVGAGFNTQGGVYAAEWSDKEIRVFYFPRDQVPADIVSGSPIPDSWGLPQSRFAVGAGSLCEGEYFNDMQIMLNTDICGDWAGNTFASNCPSLASTCTDYVKANMADFSEAYWLINSISVYSSDMA